MGNRPNLDAILKEIAKNVYYQPPEGVKMQYPAIRYKLNSIDNEHADNLVYKQETSYEVTVIDYNPDSEIRDKVSKLPMCKWNRHYTADNLNHWVFTIYY